MDSGIAGSNVVIFDLGGGTFDVSVLSMEGGVFEVRGAVEEESKWVLLRVPIRKMADCLTARMSART